MSRLGAGSVRDEAWASLKQLKRGSKEIIELAGEVEKLAKRLHPRDEEAAERHEVDAFLDALDRPLAAEVQKLGGRTMEEVVSAARRIERILQEWPTSGMEPLIESIQSQIQIITKDLAKAHEQIAAKPQAATPTAAFAAPPSNTVVAAQPPPATLAPPKLPNPAATPLPPLATAQPPPYNTGTPPYFEYREEGAPYSRGQRRQSGGRPLRCFLCDEEGHVAYRCPARTLLQRMLRQQAQEHARGPPREQILARSPELKVAQVGCRVSPPITDKLTLEVIPVLGLVDTGASVTCMGFNIWWRYSAQWGALKQFEGTVHGAHGKPLQIAGKTEHLDLQWGEARGRASFIVIVGLESPPCLIGMDIMRPLRVHIDVTNGTATPAQPDPQTIHLNAAQSQQSRKRLPSQATDPPLASQTLGETPSPRASLSPEGTADPSSTQPQRREIPLSGARSSALPSPRFLLQPPLEPYQVLPYRLPHRALPTLTLLAALGCCRQRIFPPRQRALSVATIHGPLRTSSFALMMLSRPLWPAFQRSLVVRSSGLPCIITGQSLSSFIQGKA